MALLKRCRVGLFLAASFAVIVGRGVGAQTVDEYQLKAAFLYNFAHFVEWPEPAFPDPAVPCVIGVLGSDPFGNILDALLAGERLGTHPLTVQRYQRVEDISSCHILFVSRSEEARFREILAALATRPILTVSDSENFLSAGGAIGFVTARNRVHLRVNLTVTRRSSLTLSSKLLRLAELVEGGGGAP